MSRKLALANLERHLRWERQKQDRAVNTKILEKAEEIVDTLLNIGIADRNPTVLNSLLDRAFGRSRQNIGLDGGAEDKPIVFMPASLMQRHAIKAAEYTELEEDKESEEYKENGPAGMLIEPVEEV